VRYGSVCSGIEAASVAWEPLGWEPAWFCEIDPFASALLAHRFPGVPNHGDFTRLLDPAHPVHASPIDILVGGTPCQDFSVAGLRAGVEGERGSLTLDFCRLVGVLRPKWVVWENVPGVLSSDGGRAFGAFLGALAELGYGFAWRVLDAQYFGLAQRRKRVFVVGCAGGLASRAGAVLLEPESVRGDPPARRKARKEAAGDAGGRAAESGAVAFGCDLSQKAEGIAFSEEFQPCIAGHDKHPGHGSHVLSVDLQNVALGTDVAGTLDTTRPSRGGEQAVMAFDYKQSGGDAVLEMAPTLRATPHANTWANGGGHVGIVNVEHGLHSSGNLDIREVSEPITASEYKGHSVVLQEPMTFDWQAGGGQTGEFQGGTRVYITDPPGRTRAQPPTMAVRRLTPRECERLQGFPDDWTLIPYRKGQSSDSNRYRALGNSMAVPCMFWIGARIAQVDGAVEARDTP
jgi:DNA (cytosine-5)-methyltransferase 1